MMSYKKQINKEYYIGKFFIPLHLKKFCASIIETSHSKLTYPKQCDVNV